MRNIFLRGQSHFSELFPVEFSIVVDPKQISAVSKSDKQKIKKRSSACFQTFFPLHFKIFLLPCYNFPSCLFLSIFPFFLASIFQYVSKSFLVTNIRGALCPLPAGCYAIAWEGVPYVPPSICLYSEQFYF